MHKLLRPGGVLRLSDVVYSFEPSDADERIEQWCATLPTEASDCGWVRADLEEHVRDEHSTFTWLLEPMIQRSGFRIERATYRLTASSPSTSHEPSESPLARAQTAGLRSRHGRAECPAAKVARRCRPCRPTGTGRHTLSEWLGQTVCGAVRVVRLLSSRALVTTFRQTSVMSTPAGDEPGHQRRSPPERPTG